MTMRFRVLTSAHYEDGTRYEKGKIVNSNRQLDEMFKGKFERLPDAPAKAQAATAPVSKPPAENDDESPATATPATTRKTARGRTTAGAKG